MDKQKVEIAGKMYQARDSVIELIGEKRFRAKVEEFRPIIRGLCEKKKITEMKATIEILENFRGDGHLSLLAIAACTEIMEPSL